MPVCVSTPVFDCVYKCIEKITEGHDSDTCRDLRRELPFSIKSFQFGDALFLVKAHGRLPPPSAGSLGCIHPHLPSAWFFSPPSRLHSFRHVSLFSGSTWEEENTHDLTSPLVAVLLHK